MKRKEGYMLLVSRYRAGRRLTGGAARQLSLLGIYGDLGKKTSWNHIALVDLGSKRVIAERFGPEMMSLEIGGFDFASGFKIKQIRVEPEPPVPVK